ncbi:hypothetical protein [Capnocytophaga genosp. AHN8471]|uniref:hypothetical protein n=1 Tax=Capnocytophaga genosp. AHN8471 TaxID=327574 RepID=UPI0019316360|nr:hypothetical protein [Capnocytophaga genosp. AHN8471]MBM0660056.1 hypothetical protein [Capnocytophaga genosp. AHN8471]
MNRLEFLKILAAAGIGVPLLSSFGSMPKEKVIYPNLPTVTDEFEVFDEALYKAMEKDVLGNVHKYLKDGTYFEIWKGKNDYIYNYFPFNSYFSVHKKYYRSNGYIMRKGISYVNGFGTGLWYEFDEKGHLIKTTDCDAPFTFSFEDILAYCRAYHIEVTKGYQRIGFHNRILRFVNDDGSCYWVIKHLKRYDLIEAIYLDGKTGKEINRIEIEYINN